MILSSFKPHFVNIALAPGTSFVSYSTKKNKLKMSTRGGQRGRGGGGSSKLRGHPRDTPDVQLSKTLSYLLRHGAEKEKLPIRDDGYVRVRDLTSNPRLRDLTLSKLQEMVEKDSKGRYKLLHEPDLEAGTDPTDGWWIRANQGHSIQVKLDYQPLIDPKVVPMAVHGTSQQAWSVIQKKGLSKMKRTHIHLAQGVPGSGVISGMRNTADVIIHIDLEKALAAGIQFYLSSNGVVLTEGDPTTGYLAPEYFGRVETRKGDVFPGWEGKPSEPSVADVDQQQDTTIPPTLIQPNTHEKIDSMITKDSETQ